MKLEYKKSIQIVHNTAKEIEKIFKLSALGAVGVVTLHDYNSKEYKKTITKTAPKGHYGDSTGTYLDKQGEYGYKVNIYLDRHKTNKSLIDTTIHELLHVLLYPLTNRSVVNKKSFKYVYDREEILVQILTKNFMSLLKRY